MSHPYLTSENIKKIYIKPLTNFASKEIFHFEIYDAHTKEN